MVIEMRKRGPVRGAYFAALCLSMAGPFAPTHAATKSLESAPGSGFVISADYEDWKPGLAIARIGGQFTLNRPAEKDEAGLLRFLAENPAMKSGSVIPTSLRARMRWGDLTLFELATRGKEGERTDTLPVHCAKTCVVNLSMDGIPGVSDPQFPFTTFAFFEEERARLIAGELPRARSFPVTLRVLPENISPSNAFPITFRVDVRLSFAANTRPPVYDFSSQSWRGNIGSNQAEWQALAKFLAGLRKAATPTDVANYLNKAFGNEYADDFLYTANDFEIRDGVLNVTSPLLKPDDFAAKVAAWKAIVPLGTVQDGAAVRLLFATSEQMEDVQEMPIRCSAGACRVVDMDWVSYVHGVIQQPALLRLYHSMFQKALAGLAAQK